MGMTRRRPWCSGDEWRRVTETNGLKTMMGDTSSWRE